MRPRVPKAAVGEVAEAVPDPFDLLDQAADGLGWPVGDSAGVEVGEQLISPSVDGSGQSAPLGDLGFRPLR